MHFTVLIIGDNPEDQLQPFCEHTEMEKYEVGEVEEWEMKEMRDYYTTKDHRNALISFDSLYREYGESWNGKRWEKIGEKWHEFSCYNPDSKWDWYALGGRWSGMIKLKKGATGVVGRPGVGGNKTGIDQARKKDIANLDELYTFAFLNKGLWDERGWDDAITNDEWKIALLKWFEEIGEDELISIYDCHI